MKYYNLNGVKIWLDSEYRKKFASGYCPYLSVLNKYPPSNWIQTNYMADSIGYHAHEEYRRTEVQ